MSDIFAIVNTPTLVEEGHKNVKNVQHTTQDNVYKVMIDLILQEHRADKWGVVDICKKCGFNESEILRALKRCDWCTNWLEYTTPGGYFIECMSRDRYIARIHLDSHELKVVQEVADILEGRATMDPMDCVQYIVDIARFCKRFHTRPDEISGVYNPADKFL